MALLVSGELCVLKTLCVSWSPENEVCLRSKSAQVRYAGQRMFFSSSVHRFCSEQKGSLIENVTSGGQGAGNLHWREFGLALVVTELN